MCNADSGKIFPVDIFFISNVQRSQYLIQGFISLINDDNFFAAAPLIRLHLDNLLHIYAIFINSKPHELASNLAWGKKRLKDYCFKEGGHMTDTKVLKKFFEDPENQEFLALKEVYQQTSKFIHYSDKHISALFAGNKVGNITLLSRNFIIPEPEKHNAVKAMVMITRAQIKYLIGWTSTKNAKK